MIRDFKKGIVIKTNKEMQSFLCKMFHRENCFKWLVLFDDEDFILLKKYESFRMMFMFTINDSKNGFRGTINGT